MRQPTLHAHDLRRRGQELRQHLGQMRRSAQLRQLLGFQHVRRRRHSKRLWVHQDNLRRRGQELWQHLRQVRRSAQLRHLLGDEYLWGWRYVECVRLRQNDLRCRRQELRHHPRRLWWTAELWQLQCAQQLRRRRGRQTSAAARRQPAPRRAPFALSIPDGCGGSLDCGSCPTGELCVGNTQCTTCNGSPGEWQGCRGTGCQVCVTKVAGYPYYFDHHPNCVPNNCGGLFYTCNSACPAPTAADMVP